MWSVCVCVCVLFASCCSRGKLLLLLLFGESKNDVDSDCVSLLSIASSTVSVDAIRSFCFDAATMDAWLLSLRSDVYYLYVLAITEIRILLPPNSCTVRRVVVIVILVVA